MKNKNLILVPTDFTSVAETAIQVATDVAKTIQGEIRLLHVVARSAQTDDVQSKLNAEAERYTRTTGIPAEGIVKVGNIFDDIGDVAASISASLIIMGTHGVKGLQHLTGSYALRVITNSSVPFIVVQQGTSFSGFQKILLPLDLSKETKQKLNVTVQLARAFQSKVYVVAPKEHDEFLARKVNLNVAFAKNYLSDNKVPAEVIVSEEKGTFAKQVLRHAEKLNCDLIAIVNSTDSAGFPDIFGSGSEQQILTNDMKLPVLCMNPAKVTVTGSIFYS